MGGIAKADPAPVPAPAPAVPGLPMLQQLASNPAAGVQLLQTAANAFTGAAMPVAAPAAPVTQPPLATAALNVPAVEGLPGAAPVATIPAAANPLAAVPGLAPAAAPAAAPAVANPLSDLSSLSTLIPGGLPMPNFGPKAPAAAPVVAAPLAAPLLAPAAPIATAAVPAAPAAAPAAAPFAGVFPVAALP